MFFRKKKPETPPETSAQDPEPRRGELRKEYRVRPRATQPIRASLERKAGTPLAGDCIDLSIGGTWVEFASASEFKLAQGDICTLEIRADSHPDAVKATCRVVSVLALDKGGVRVGFQFMNRIQLYAQLDEFYARRFNRRRHVRVVPDYDVRIPVKLVWRTGSLPAVAHDISEGGLGIVVPREKAKALVKVSEIDLTFRLPRERTDIACRAVIKSRTEFASTCLLGIEFSPGGGIENHIANLRRCIEKRLAAFQDWNAKLGKSTLSKRAS